MKVSAQKYFADTFSFMIQLISTICVCLVLIVVNSMIDNLIENSTMRTDPVMVSALFCALNMNIEF